MMKKKKIRLTPQRRKTPKNKLYFATEHEQAIKLYVSSNDWVVKNNLYNNFIGPVFSEMVSKIVYTFKFTTLPNIEELKDECRVFLTTILNKFDSGKGYKAFSYFSVIAKNWFIHKTKKNILKFKKEISFDDVSVGEENLKIENNFFEDRNRKDFLNFLFEEMELWKKIEDLKQNEAQILSAIQELFKNLENIEIFNKKAVFIYLMNLTGLSAKQIACGLGKLRKRYEKSKASWNNDEIL